MKKNSILLTAFLLLAGVIYIVYNIQSKNIKSEPKQETPVPIASDKYVSVTQGYSLYLTKNYKISTDTKDNETMIVHASGNPDNGVTWIVTEPANGRTVDQVVKAEFANQGEAAKGLNIKTSALKIDGEQAVVIEPLTGQNLIRQINVIHNGILYRMNFTPDDPKAGERYVQMDDLYKTIVDTFRFTE